MTGTTVMKFEMDGFLAILYSFYGIRNSNVEILHVLIFSLCDSKLHKCKTLFHNSSVISSS